MCRQYSDGTRTLDGDGGPGHRLQQVNRYDSRVAMLREMVNESTTDGVVPANALAGRIPTEIGQLAQLRALYLYSNQLTGACRETPLVAIGKRVYH